MNKNTTYLYSDKTKIVKGQEYFTVYKVNEYNNAFLAERKARTVAKKRNDKLAGGYFSAGSKPYNFETHYKVINVPDNTKASRVTKHDKFIMELIKNETSPKTENCICECGNEHYRIV